MQSFQQAIEAVDFYSPAEERFNRRRRTIGLWLAPLLFAGLLLWPTRTLSPEAHRLLAVLVAVAVLWLTEALPLAVTALLGPALAVVLGVTTAQQALAPFADPIIFLFIGSFILAEAMFVHGLDRRIAYTALSSKFVGTSAPRLLLVYGGVATALSMWVSNTATTAMMFPIGMAIVAHATHNARPGDTAGRQFAVAMMLTTAFGACIGGMATPVGTPPNLIGIGMLQRLGGTRISFVGWMAIGVPAVLVLFVLLMLLVAGSGLRRYRIPEPAIESIRAELARLGPWSPGQRNVVIAFAVTLVLWLLPGLRAFGRTSFTNIDQVYASTIPEGIAAIFGAVLLFVLPVDWKTRRFTLTWEEAARIDWGIVLVYGGGLTLGQLAFSTGLASAIGRPLVEGAGLQSVLALTALFTAAGILVSQTTSNTAAAAILVPVAIAACETAHVSPLAPVVGTVLGVSMGFVLPISSASNAIVYSSGYVPIRSMVRYGVILDVLAFFVIVTVAAFLGPFLH
ncbi:MAG TPA: DASS family sodium-coupled anion symporter [Vicinamibacterales bacterium]|nr:DASS family sodium-coupled anion symporter [Vicinamibacterales bacterium]